MLQEIGKNGKREHRHDSSTVFDPMTLEEEEETLDVLSDIEYTFFWSFVYYVVLRIENNSFRNLNILGSVLLSREGQCDRWQER